MILILPVFCFFFYSLCFYKFNLFIYLPHILNNNYYYQPQFIKRFELVQSCILHCYITYIYIHIYLHVIIYTILWFFFYSVVIFSHSVLIFENGRVFKKVVRYSIIIICTLLQMQLIYVITP